MSFASQYPVYTGPYILNSLRDKRHTLPKTKHDQNYPIASQKKTSSLELTAKYPKNSCVCLGNELTTQKSYHALSQGQILVVEAKKTIDQDKREFSQKAFKSKFFTQITSEIFPKPPKTHSDLMVRNQTIALIKNGFLEVLKRPGTFEKLQEFNLTPEETFALYLYTRQSPKLYEKINDGLRLKKELSPALKNMINNMISGLAKLPGCVDDEGECSSDGQTVFRAVNLPDKVGKKYREGEIIADHGFFSTTKSHGQVKGKAPKHRLMIVLGEKTNGRNISFLSEYPDEDEFLFPPKTGFEIKHSQKQKRFVLGKENTNPKHKSGGSEALFIFKEVPDQRSQKAL